MSDRATVKVQVLTFGAAGTSTISGTTNTSNPVPLPRDDYTVQVSYTTTGTSIAGGSVVWQTSNDGVGWVAANTAALTSTNASTSSTVAAGGFAMTTKYAYGRGVLATTGTGYGQAFVGS